MSEVGRKLEAPPAKQPLIIENLEPSDLLPKILLPNMVKEHVARYKYVYDFVKNQSSELVNQNVNILDIASARGYGSDILKKEFNKAQVIGVEYRGKYVVQADRKYNASIKELNFLQGDARMLPLKNDSVDIVTAFEIVEHLPKKDQRLLFKEITRVLKPEGLAFISFPHRYSFEKNKQNETVRITSGGNPYHLYEPLPADVDKYIADSKLEILGKFGQILVSEKNADIVKRINKIIPIWSVFAWTPNRDVSISKIPTGKVGITNIYVLKKSSV